LRCPLIVIVSGFSTISVFSLELFRSLRILRLTPRMLYFTTIDIAIIHFQDYLLETKYPVPTVLLLRHKLYFAH